MRQDAKVSALESAVARLRDGAADAGETACSALRTGRWGDRRRPGEAEPAMTLLAVDALLTEALGTVPFHELPAFSRRLKTILSDLDESPGA